MFEAYEDEFSALTREVGKKISHASSYEDDPEKKLAQLRECNGTLQQAKDLIKSMEVEVRSMDAGTKRELMEKVGQYKKTLASVQRDHADTQRQAEEEQNTLLCGSGQNNYGEATADQRGRLVASNERLERGSGRIRHAMEIVVETEDTALEITEELARNREKIESTSARVRQVSDLTGHARRLIHSMTKREKQQKIMLGCVGLFLVAALGTIIWLVTRKK